MNSLSGVASIATQAVDLQRGQGLSVSEIV